MIFDLCVNSSADETVLEDLGNWLDNDFELRGAVRRSAPQPEIGKMGYVSDLLSVAVASGGAIAALAASLRVWFAQPRRSDVSLKITTAAGDMIEIDAKRVDNVEALLQAMLAREATARLTAEGDAGAATGS